MSHHHGIHADDSADFNLIQSWLSSCSKHPVCNRPSVISRKDFLPTRLIEIDAIKGNNAPKLVDSSDINISSDTRYIALSHCWGDREKVPKTIKDTLAEHRQAILGLSKTMLDSIEVTQRLGLRYIWIDSLCIIQDDEADFRKECAVMSLVYTHAHLTISAQGARDGDDGLFVPSQIRSGEQAKSLDWIAAIQGPLSTRGWAFQEHQLSPRIVHFTTSKMVWECRVAVACEHRPGLLYRALAYNGVGLSKSPGFQLIYWRLFDGRHERFDKFLKRASPMSDGVESFHSDNPHLRNDIYTRWLRAVELYSARQLTYNTDKLFAVSGLAAASAEIIGNKAYYAGIWGDDFVRGLLWYPTQYSTSTSSPLQPNSRRLSLFPSWSWASYPGSVHFLGTYVGRPNQSHMKEIGIALTGWAHIPGDLAEVQQYTILPGQDPFSHISDGVIRIRTVYVSEELFLLGTPDDCQHRLVNQNMAAIQGIQIFCDYKYSRYDQLLEVTLVALMWDSDTSFGLVLQRSGAKYQRVGIFFTLKEIRELIGEIQTIEVI